MRPYPSHPHRILPQILSYFIDALPCTEGTQLHMDTAMRLVGLSVIIQSIAYHPGMRLEPDITISSCQSTATSDCKAMLLRGVQRHPRRRKMRCRNPRGMDKNKEVGGGAKFKFGQLILRKIIKIFATRYHILRLRCTKFDFGWGSAPRPCWESSQRSTRCPS